MNTNSDLRPFLGKAILGSALAMMAILTTGCSDAAQPTAQTSCNIAPLSRTTDAPTVQVALTSSTGKTPDVTVRGSGFPAGARVSIAYVGLPGREPGGTTVDLDFENVATVTDAGSFAITQHRVYDLMPCSEASASTVGVAVGAEGKLTGTTLPSSFWCEGNTTESYGDACE